jgi:hypothetical protein
MFHNGSNGYFDFSSGGLIWRGAGQAERMRLDNTGDLFVGGTTGGQADAVTISGDGYVQARMTSNFSGSFERLSTDGDIIRLRKDTTTVGSIGVANNDIPYITAAEGTSGLRFDGDNSNIKPSDGSGANLNDVISLGASGTRFKDLYLSGAATIGGDLYVNGSATGTDYEFDIGNSDTSVNFYASRSSGVNKAYRFLTSNTGASEAMRIDSTGNVGIATSTPQNELDVRGTVEIGNGSTQRMYLQGTGTDFRFYDRANLAERLRIDSSGTLLVGMTSDAANTVGIRARGEGLLTSTRDGSQSAIFGRKTSDGNIVLFQKDGTDVGSIGVASGDRLYIAAPDSSPTGLVIDGDNARINPSNGTGADRDNAVDLGHSGSRWNDAFITNGVTTGSDMTEKQQIAVLSDAEMTAAKAISALFKTYKWNSAVDAKGDDARIHTGVMAQEVAQALTDAGLDAGQYAFYMSDTWWEHSVDVPAVAEETDEDGNVTVEAQEAYTRTDTYDTAEEAPEGATERNRKGIRYPELLSFVGAATEQRLANIETRLTALESA